MTKERIEWGVQVPERERFGPNDAIIWDGGEDSARRFVAAHPECPVVKRTVTISDWEEA